ncbi:sortase-like acyltransferase [Desulfosporosinus orientis DSM 765]|uniref:Sortase-like acyltransferase n=1 Tax=Desulfosporosinus orientis (strain ATCC 19365 / DSM 765 / NCIMB 8382 / VKM B-1628 / Singapore I) TaxID=768706 RepID=G7W8S5_DESOD|nr:GNAT family N-acetyltransferase [Desulfosporosinus orientis]AET67785.1 sortase-like acyltransferase [Desulfosporosinus orientis DSM 765]
MANIIIRQATEGDAAEILEIYAPYIKETNITFEYEVPTLDDFKKRIQEIASHYPYIVCLLDGKMVGYAYAHRHMERAAYQWNAELSVYVAKDCLRLGIGKALYNALIEILKLQNVQNLYAIVTYPNPNSEKMHQYFGFQTIGIYPKTGYKFGQWIDVIWLEKSIGEHEKNPKPLVSIGEISGEVITNILDKCSAAIKRSANGYTR